jgi:hypothetical protein
VWGSGGIAPPFLLSALDGGDQLHAPAALTPGNCTRYLLHRRLGGHHNRSGRYAEEKNLALRGKERRPSSPSPVAISALFCSETSLHWPACLLVGNITEAAFHISLVLMIVNNGMAEMSVLGEARGGGRAVLSS